MFLVNRRVDFGTDNIPTRFLKRCAEEIAEALTLLYNAM